MRALDFYSGAHSVGNVLKERGWDVVSVDIDPATNPDIVANVLDLTLIDLCDIYGTVGFDFIWASPPCECFSVASIGHHWHKGGIPKTERAVEAKNLLVKTVDILRFFNPPFWAMENPRGMMRKMEALAGVPRATVSYCQYGDSRMKPTDIFGVLPPAWVPKMCRNGAPCHEAAPRGARTGTQGLKTYLDRSAIPRQLIEEIATELERQ